ncbi:MAG: hypothetical protein U9P71_00565 [Campylobacterota bacterium]|nr:hypothetical protein [Campylobacterota bacterium]
MKQYQSDGKKLLHVEYDDQPGVGDIVDGMSVISANERDGDLALFLQDSNGQVGVFVLDEIYIVGRVFGFENLVEAIEAWISDEI